jgi:large subunit ribosomal protein L35
MPKLKTKSGVKKRFKVTASGKIKAGQANKRHNMRKRSKRQLRNQRGTAVLPHMEGKRIEQFIPYSL